MNLRILLVYINTLIILATCVIQYQAFGTNFQIAPLSVITVSLLLITNIELFLKNRYSIILLIYLMGLIMATIISKEKHLAYISIFFGPFLISTLIKKKEKKFYRPLFYLFIIVFIINGIAAFYERVSGDRIMPVALNNDVLQGQMDLIDNDSNTFRSFAFFGHPLTNGNIMAFMSFVIFYTRSIPQKLRIFLTIFGLSSLFCFNTRGAILVSAFLLIPALYNYIRFDAKNKLFITIILISACILLYNYFQLFGGRLIASSINDENATVRILTFNEFFSYPLSDLLIGGINMKYGENGYLLTLAYYGLIIGAIKIIVEIYLSYKLIGNVSLKIEKMIMMLSSIAIGSTNNNLFFPVVTPLYILFITFVINNQKIKPQYNNANYKKKIKTIY